MLLSLVIFYFKAIRDLDEFSTAYGIEQSWEQPKNPKKVGKILWGGGFTLFGIIFICISLGIFTINPQTIAKNMLSFIVVFTCGYFLYLMFLPISTLKREKVSLSSLPCLSLQVCFGRHLSNNPFHSISLQMIISIASF